MEANKEIMAFNIKRLMNEKHVNQTEVCQALGLKQNTFSDWMNAKSYPRIDKIEMLSKYFGVDKSSLVEKYDPHHLTSSDLLIIDMYKSADKQTQDMIKRLLSYSKLVKKEGD